MVGERVEVEVVGPVVGSSTEGYKAFRDLLAEVLILVQVGVTICSEEVRS